MKLVSKFALALSLVTVSAAPAAFAQSDEKPKKEKKGKEASPAAPKRNYSKPFIAAYMPVANLLNKLFAGMSTYVSHLDLHPLCVPSRCTSRTHQAT